MMRCYGIYRRQVARGLVGPTQHAAKLPCPGCQQITHLFRDAARPEQPALCVECLRRKE